MTWTIEHARDIYNIAHWSGGYFDVNPQGHIIARPDRKHPGVDMHQLTEDIHQAGLSLPALVRFTGILHDRVDTLCNAFTQAMAADNYQARFTAVYPIKVNQQRSVVEQILAHGGKRVGLEAGSKPELLAVLALVTAAVHECTSAASAGDAMDAGGGATQRAVAGCAGAANGGTVVCNGYKDREYIRLALIGKQLGQRVYIVVEKLSELDLILQEARKLEVQPLLGVRVRLASIGAGKWQNTGGEKSKFGLSATQVLEVVERLRAADMLESLQLLHFHLGSQIANIRDIQNGMREAARYYAELHRLGVKIACVDVGGGLGVDYEGTRSRSFCSMNYSVEEYANNVVHALWETCAAQGLPHPDIITESGRAMTAHHAVLITNVTDIDRIPDGASLTAPGADEPLIIQDLWLGLSNLSSRSALEAYHDAQHWLAEAQSMYTHGVLTLEQRSRAEQIYFATCHKVRTLLQPGAKSHRDALDELNEKLADKYFCNFSLFQSMPDVWAIDQIFPVIPLHRLDEQPTQRAVIEDLTCDSDGCIEHYVDREGIESTLPVHSYQPGDSYLLGIFLIGAYQEILGDMHNLFGDTDSVNVELTPEGGYRLTQAERGDTVESVLRYVHFDAADLLAAYRTKINNAPLSTTQRNAYLEELAAGLEGYTYLEE